MKVEITETHIKSGIHPMQAALPAYDVKNTGFGTFINGIRVGVPDAFIDWLNDYDFGGVVQPITFEVDFEKA